MSCRLFIIANPTHLIGVKNYIETHKKKKNYVILAIKYYKNHKNFIEVLRKEASLDLLRIFYIKQDKTGVLLYHDVLRKMILIELLGLKNYNFDEVLFTNYYSWFQNYLVSKSGAKKIILISDGTGIFDVVENRKITKKTPFKANKIFVDKILRLKPIEYLNIYSPVNLKTAPGDSLEIFRFKGLEARKVDQQKIYFVGSPLVELSYISSEFNSEYFTKIRNFFKPKNIYYFAHRRESDENLKNYHLFDEIIRDKVPFETRLSTEKILPGIIISYLSSVLINLPEVYPNIQFIYLPLENDQITKDEFIPKYKNLKSNFENLKSKNFKALTHFNDE